MKSIIFPCSLLLWLAVVMTPSSGFAIPLNVHGEEDQLKELLENGWAQVAPGVLQRTTGGHRIETLATGAAGFSWALGQLQAHLGFLLDEDRIRPTAELGKAIRDLEMAIWKLEGYVQDLQLRKSAAMTATTSCTFSYSAHADAYPATSFQGVGANADASFSDDCGDPGDTFAHAFARATLNGTTTTVTQTDPNSGPTISSYATASVAGTADCYSYANAWASSSPRELFYSVADENFECGPTDQVPFSGKPFAVPGTIKAADFDNGGEGIAHHEVTPDTGSSYRATTVDLFEDTVVRLESGDWLEYTIDVGIPGTYALVAQVGAEVWSGGSFHIELDGLDVTGPLAVPSTGSWHRWDSAVRAGVSFPAGRHVLRFVVDAGFDGFQSLRIVVAQVPFGGTVRTLPGTLRVADFDEGGEQISYHDNTAGCDGSCSYRKADVDRWETYVFRTTPGEWMEYTVDVTATGTYTLAFQVGSENGGGTFHMELDGANVTGPITIPLTGGWSTFQTVTRTGVSLTAGRHVMRLVIDSDAGHSEAGTFDTISVQP